MPADLRSRIPWLLLALAVVVTDQVTKALVVGAMELHQSRPLVDGLLSLTHVQNSGGAFGMLSDWDIPGKAVLFGLVGLGAFAALVAYALRIPPTQSRPQAALALVMGGALGNLVDRARHGFVVDFIDAHWGAHHWPAFNAADSAISVGVALLVLDVFLEEPRPAVAPAPPNPAGSE